MYTKWFTSGIVVFILLVFPFITVVSASSLMWSQTYGGLGGHEPKALVETPDGGLALAGGTLLLKTDSYGNLEWTQTFVGEIYSLIVTSDGGFALAGYTDSSVDESDDFWLAKTDEQGNVEWTQTYGGTNYEQAYCLVENSDGGYVLCGETGESLSLFGTIVSPHIWLVKTDENGTEEWTSEFGFAQSNVNSLVVASDGGYTIAGSIDTLSDGNEDFWLFKLDTYGVAEWTRNYGGPMIETARSLVVTSDGGYALGGITFSFGAGAYDFWLVKTDEYGNMEWNQTYGGTNYDQAYGLVESSHDGGFVLAGVKSTSRYTESQDFWLVKTDVFGNMEWNQTYGGTDFERATCLVEISDGGYALAGPTWSFGDATDCLLVKTDEYGIVPEHHSLLIFSSLLTAILVILINKKRLFSKHS
jgi:hypothetical protein